MPSRFSKSSAHRVQQTPSSSKRPHYDDDEPSSQRQSTLSELFSSQQKVSQTENFSTSQSSAGKRVKLDRPASFHHSKPNLKATTAAPQHINSTNMLSNFPSSQGKGNGAVVDLTGSSPSSSQTSTSPKAGAPFSKLQGLGNPGGFGNGTVQREGGGVKRIVVKNLRKSSKELTQQYCRNTTETLELAVTEILNGIKTSRSKEELYRGAETLCRQGQAPQLSDRLKTRLTEYVKDSLKEPIKAKVGLEDIQVLQATLTQWEKWMEQVKNIRWIFFFLDRSYLLNTKGQLVINDLGVQLFTGYVFKDADIQPKIIQGMCDLIEYERTGAQARINTVLLREAFKMIRALGVYSKYLEPKLVSTSEGYYNRFAKEQSTTLPAYLRSCRQLILDESDRGNDYGLDNATQRELADLRDDAIVSGKSKFLTDAAAVSLLLEADALGDLAILYSLLNTRSSVKSLRGPWQAFIRKEGNAILEDEAERANMIVRLLIFKQKLDKICQESFQGNADLAVSLRESFSGFLNERKKASSSETNNSRAGEMIAKHMDMLLRGGIKAVPSSLKLVASNTTPENGMIIDDTSDEDAELNRQLDLALELFRFIEGKDVFEAFYKSDLSRRLLMGRSASDDAERSMLTKLRTECGSNFTHNLVQMFKDIDLARDEMSSYKTMLRDRGRTDKIDLTVNVLSSAAWPSFRDISLKIPEEVGVAIDRYDQYYKSKHTGRILNWRHDLAQCVMRASFPKGQKEIVFSSAQASVMLLFNEVEGAEHLSYGEIKSATGLPPEKLAVTLQSLACAKIRVLTKHPRGKDINSTDTFNVNVEFTDPKYRIKINNIQLKETKAENRETHEQVVRDRQYETQAAIVRIMKGRKTIKHAELVVEVINQTKKRGHLEVGEIKTQIDKLIDKDYLERDGDGGIGYVA